ncbi:N(2)-fixation sustaining protein CowN [Marinobacterium zhoushanense]
MITATNRYISFCGIECDTQANSLMKALIANLDSTNGNPNMASILHLKLEE